jgi:hypothetical protein
VRSHTGKEVGVLRSEFGTEGGRNGAALCAAPLLSQDRVTRLAGSRPTDRRDDPEAEREGLDLLPRADLIPMLNSFSEY